VLFLYCFFHRRSSRTFPFIAFWTSSPNYRYPLPEHPHVRPHWRHFRNNLVFLQVAFFPRLPVARQSLPIANDELYRCHRHAALPLPPIFLHSETCPPCELIDLLLVFAFPSRQMRFESLAGAPRWIISNDPLLLFLFRCSFLRFFARS